MTQTGWFVEIAWKGTLILLAAFAAARCLRGASAAARHFLWTAAFCAVLLLPLAAVAVPHWAVPPRAGSQVAAAVRAAPAYETGLAVRPQPARSSGPVWLLIWALGCAIAAARLAIGSARTRWIRRRATPAEHLQGLADIIGKGYGIRRRVPVLEAADAPVPLTCGSLRPAILLPPGAADWPEARLEAVLRHELAHVRRFDVAAQWAGQAACCLYWFQPLAWMAARRLRREREAACDDAVLASGTSAGEYAAALLDAARSLSARRRGWANAAGMACCDLESRIRRLFDEGRSRGPLRRRTAAAIGAAMFALLLPAASLTGHAQAARGSLGGVVQDPSGARVPGCRVVARNQDGANEEMTRANAAGEYLFRAIPAGNYVLEFVSPGFAPEKQNATVAAAVRGRLDATLELGSISDHFTIRGERPPAAPPLPPRGAPQRIRVGGNVQPVRLLRQIEPDYPAELQAQGVEGTVVVRAVISTSGDVLSPVMVNTDIDPRLAQLALDAVKQWRYQPALLNGEPVETRTTVAIDFTLEPKGRKSAR